MLGELGMTTPNRPMHNVFNREFERERQYDINVLSQSVQRKVPLLNRQQKTAYVTIMKIVNNGDGRFFFLDAAGFLISLVLDTIRAQCQIALALASSGIAAILLES